MLDRATKELIREVAALRLQLAELEARLKLRQRELVDALGPSARHQVDGWRVLTTRPRAVIRVAEPADVPVAYRTWTPDRRAITAAWRRGEAVPGTRLQLGPPTLTLRQAEDA